MTGWDASTFFAAMGCAMFAGEAEARQVLPRMIVRIGELAERPGRALLRPAHQIAFEEQLFGRGSFGAHPLHEVRWSI